MKKKATPYNIDENGRVTITREELEVFKEIVFKEYGKHLTDEQAYEQGFALLNLFDQMIKQIVNKRKYEQRSSA